MEPTVNILRFASLVEQFLTFCPASQISGEADWRSLLEQSSWVGEDAGGWRKLGQWDIRSPSVLISLMKDERGEERVLQICGQLDI